MQRWPGDNQRGSQGSRFGKIGVYTLLCFSLAGLIGGFSFGGFMGHFSKKTTNSSASSNRTSVIAHQAPNSSATVAPENVQLGNPVVGAGDYRSPQKADGTTSYTFSTQIVYKGSTTPITATDVTCRLWLTNDANAMATALSANNYAIPRTISGFAQPFPNEVAGALNFTSPSNQTQPCASNGKTTWTYTLSTTVQPGTYYMVVLADWKGIHYNWYMVSIKVFNGNNGGNGDNGNSGGNQP